jgi:DNA-binding LacI/PurR family transcriptional regulator
MARKKLRSIADVAELAGFSKATVSRALNDSSLVGEKTKDKILAIAKEYGFRPSAAARNLSLHSSKTIAFVTHAYDDDCSSITDPFSLEIMGGVAKGLFSLGYDMLVAHVSPRDTDWVDSYIDSGKVDGFILMTSERKRKHIDLLLEKRAPFVAWGFGEGFCTVRGDDRRGGGLAGARLASLGRSRIGFLGGPRAEIEVQMRQQGFAESLDAAGLVLDKRCLAYGDYGEESGAAAIGEILDREPGLDALFSCSDIMAIAAIRELRRRGRRVPEDVAVIGYDDLRIASYVTPALTTVSQNIGMAGAILARDLAANLETGIVSCSTVPVELKIRASA